MPGKRGPKLSLRDLPCMRRLAPEVRVNTAHPVVFTVAIPPTILLRALSRTRILGATTLPTREPTAADIGRHVLGHHSRDIIDEWHGRWAD